MDLPVFRRLRNLVTRGFTICPVCAQPVEMRADHKGFKAHDIPPHWSADVRRCWASGKHPAEIRQLYRTFASTLDYRDVTARFSANSRVEIIDEADSVSLLAWSEVNDEITARVLVNFDKDSLLRFLDEVLTLAQDRDLIDHAQIANGKRFGMDLLKERH